MGRHSCCYKQKLRKGLWSPEEDEKLLRHITQYGHGCWSSVPKLAGTFQLVFFFVSFLFRCLIKQRSRKKQYRFFVRGDTVNVYSIAFLQEAILYTYLMTFWFMLNDHCTIITMYNGVPIWVNNFFKNKIVQVCKGVGKVAG